MGPGVLRFLREELEQNSDVWFWALRAITGHDPVPPEHRGQLPEMRQAWLRWFSTLD